MTFSYFSLENAHDVMPFLQNYLALHSHPPASRYQVLALKKKNTVAIMKSTAFPPTPACPITASTLP
jgi:hypothetical protein